MIGLLPLRFRFRSLLSDRRTFRVWSNWMSFTGESPQFFFFFKQCSELSRNALKELGSYSSLSFFFTNCYKELSEILVQFLSSQFFYLPSLAFHNKKLVEQSKIVLLLFLGVFFFLFVYRLFY